MLAAAIGTLLPAVENAGKDGFQPLGLKQAVLQMAGDQVVQFLHRYGHPFAAGRTLPRPGRARVVAIATALAGSDGHGAAAPGAVDKAGEHGRAADHAGGHDLRVAGFEQRLDRIERQPIDDRRHRNRYYFAGRLPLFGLRSPVEVMLAHIGQAGQDAVDLSDPPASAVAGEDAVAIEVGDDVLDAHLARCAVALKGKAVDQPHGLGVQGINLQLLLDLRSARLGGDGAIADGRQRSVPEALAGILLQGSDDVLGILLGLILVEQRHDLAHHDVHGIVAHLLRDGDELHPVLRQLADIELELEVVAEEAREAVNHDDIEGRGLGGSRLDHPLELGPTVVGG